MGCLPCLGMGSDPGGHQVWPFDPGLSQYTPVHSELPLFPPIWGPLTVLHCCPLSMGGRSPSITPTSSTPMTRIPVRRPWGITWSRGKSGAGRGSDGMHRSTLGPYTTSSGKFRPSGGPLTVLHCCPLSMDGCSFTVVLTPSASVSWLPQCTACTAGTSVWWALLFQ